LVVFFSTTSRDNGEYLRNETRYGQSGNDVEIHEGHTPYQDFMNFGARTAKIGPEFSPSFSLTTSQLNVFVLQHAISNWKQRWKP